MELRESPRVKVTVQHVVKLDTSGMSMGSHADADWNSGQGLRAVEETEALRTLDVESLVAGRRSEESHFEVGRVHRLERLQRVCAR